jgi:putative ATP-binding cassette transporter
LEAGVEPFEASINWSTALVDSLWWIAKAWGITAFCVLVSLVLIRYFTVWGRQFWRITGDYFTGTASVKVWAWLGVLLLSVLTGVRLTVLFSYQGRDLTTAVQTALQGIAGGSQAVKDSGVHGFWMSLGIFCIMAVLHVCRVMLDIFMMQRFILAWRVWLTDRLTADWLDGKAYYRSRFISDAIDNPDQRIQQDVDIFTTGVGGIPNSPSYGTTSTLLFGAVSSVVSVVSFTPILWQLSGTLSILGVAIPRALFWSVLIYVLIASVFAFWIGRPLIRLSFNNERFNAVFRYALVRLRDAAEAVAFYRGELAERVQLGQRFQPVVGNYRRFINRSVGFLGWNLSVSQTIVPLPWLLQAPRLFAGEIKFGEVTQAADAFGNIHDSLSFFRNAYDQFAGYRAAVIRLHGLVQANEQGRAMPEMAAVPSVDGCVDLRQVEVRTPSGRQLVEPLDLRLGVGESLVVTGRSGAGKTTLLRSLAQLWPYASGTLCRPDAPNETMFLSQMPYVPLGDLRGVVSYPAKPGEIPDAELQRVLAEVALANLADRLDEVCDWAKVLSPGEQQRIAFARILLTKPKAVFLDEATSALDAGLEFELYRRVREALPDLIMVSVTHRLTVEQHHDRQLELLGEGQWRLGRVEGGERERELV